MSNSDDNGGDGGGGRGRDGQWVRVIVDWIAKAGKADEYPKTEEGLRNLTELNLSGCGLVVVHGLKGASFFGLVGPN